MEGDSIWSGVGSSAKSGPRIDRPGRPSSSTAAETRSTGRGPLRSPNPRPSPSRRHGEARRRRRGGGSGRAAPHQEGALRAAPHRSRVHPRGDGHQGVAVSEQEASSGIDAAPRPRPAPPRPRPSDASRIITSLLLSSAAHRAEAPLRGRAAPADRAAGEATDAGRRRPVRRQPILEPAQRRHQGAAAEVRRGDGRRVGE